MRNIIFWSLAALVLVLVLMKLRQIVLNFRQTDGYLFRLEPGESIVHQWPVYSPSEPSIEPVSKAIFPFLGELFWMVITDQNRLIFGQMDKQPLAFDCTKIVFKKTDRPGQLKAFARVATDVVLEMQLPDSDIVLELHVPEEAVEVLLK